MSKTFARDRLNTPDGFSDAPVLRRGLVISKSQISDLITHGMREKEICCLEVPGEDLDFCLGLFRGRRGELVIPGDLRIFGNSRGEVLGTMAELHRRKITVRDVAHPEDGDNPHLMERRALTAISASRFLDKRKSRHSARRGGKIKGQHAAKRRDAISPADVIRNIVNCPKLTWADRVAIFGNSISKASLRRHYSN